MAAVTFVTLIVLAWRNGRTYCNTICPVGTVLGFFSRYSLFRPVIDTEKCNGCGLCARKCKAACIDSSKHRIDYSRCVDCMDCIDACRQGAVGYRFRFAKTGAKPAVAFEAVGDTRKPDTARRSFLTGLGLLAASAAVRAQEKKVDGGLAVILDKKIPDRATPSSRPEPGVSGIWRPTVPAASSACRYVPTAYCGLRPSGDPDAARNVL